MRALIEAGADVNCENREGHTPLLNACASDDFKGVKILLDAGADISPKDHMGRDALHFAKGTSFNNLIVGAGVHDAIVKWPKKKKVRLVIK